jgi:DNA-binding Lrp family transcriptional regulator
MRVRKDMVNAFVNIKCEKKTFSKLAKELLKIKGVTEVYAVTGDFDLIAVIRAATHEIAAKIVTDSIMELESIEDTNTVIALNTYTQYDLDTIFKGE